MPQNHQIDQRPARIAGFLFLNAIVFLFIGEALYRPHLTPLDLDAVARNGNVYLAGVLLEWIASVPLILAIPILLYPIFQRHAVRAAVAYLSLRLLEVALLTVADVGKLSILSLSRRDDRELAIAQAETLLDTIAWIDSAGLIYNLVFGTSALVLFGTLLAARLVPRLLSAWGLFAAVALMSGSLLFAFGAIPENLGPVFWGPIALAEVILAVWLMLRGVGSDG